MICRFRGTMPEFLNQLDDFAQYLPRLGGVIVLLLLVWVGYRILRRAIRVLRQRKHVSEHMVLLLERILRWATLVLAIILVLQSSGLLQDFWTFLSTILALVAIGFVAVWSVLSNVMCSVILMFSRPFKVGDVIILPSQQLEGEVVNFNLLFTILRAENGELIQIPNNTFFQTPIRRRLGTMDVSLEEQLEKTENAK